MADLTINAANVIAGAGATTKRGVAGETITAGRAVYYDSLTDKWRLADSNSGTAAARTPGGIALNGASDGQPLFVHTKGLITIGATVTAGVAYYLSDTPGGICPVADLATGEFPSVIGIAKSASVLEINITSAGVAL